jgi:hypothetical protein
MIIEGALFDYRIADISGVRSRQARHLKQAEKVIPGQ